MLDGGAGTGYASATPWRTAAQPSASTPTTARQNTVGAGTDTLTNFENLTGSAFNDTLMGDAHANILSGGAGDDLLMDLPVQGGEHPWTVAPVSIRPARTSCSASSGA